MTTLAKDTQRDLETGTVDEIPVIATEIIYEFAAVGIVLASGHARPLVAGDVFGGFAEQQVDNSDGAAAAKRVRTIKNGAIRLSVTGAVITDRTQPVYASDDDTFVFTPTGNTFIGFVRRFVSAGEVIVGFDTDNYRDPYAKYGAVGEYETLSGAKTLDIQDNGKVFFVDTTAVITFPAVATGLSCTLVNIGAYGDVQISADPAAADSIHAPDIAGTDNKDHINTLATSQRGDLVKLVGGLVATGYNVTDQVGTWAQEA